MKMIRITKEFKFEMAHALHGYDGVCANIHGHSYRLWVTVKGKRKEELGHPKNGMVMDFVDLKKVVKPNIVDKFDHALVLNANSPHADINLEAFDKVYHLDYQPTSENLVIDFANYIKAQLPDGVSLVKVVLSETATSFAEWNFEDIT
ncbi:MAG: 6-carboxytetrahydropterin synthase [Flavobacteriales bacterium]|nr:6-carboxytetrahydropterin synthase [Flavobacteriales bacterium]